MDFKFIYQKNTNEGCTTTSLNKTAPCAVPVLQKRHKTEAPSQSPNSAGSLIYNILLFI